MNYGQLKTAVAGYAHRSDLEPLMDTFAELAANRIGRDTRLLELERNATFVADTDNTIPLPDRYMRMIAITTPGATGPLSLEYVTPSYFDKLNNNGGNGPRYYTIEDNLILLGPAGGEVNLTWQEKPTYFTNDNDTNEALANWSNLYLYGMLIEAFEWAMDTNNMIRAFETYKREVRECNIQADDARASGAPLVMRGYP